MDSYMNRDSYDSLFTQPRENNASLEAAGATNLNQAHDASLEAAGDTNFNQAHDISINNHPGTLQALPCN